MSRSEARIAGRGRPGALLVSEITVLFRRKRTWAMLAALAAVPVLIGVAVKLASNRAPGQGPGFVDRISQNGLFLGLAALVLSIPLFLPLTVGVVSGDTIAGEASQGTLRYLLVVVAGSIVGALLFPVGPVPLLSGDEISPGEALLRLLLVACFVAVSLVGMSAIGLFVSTVTDVPVGAMATTVVLAVASQVLDALPQTEWLHPWLFTHYWLGLVDLLRQPIEWASFRDDALLQLGYAVVFGALAYGRFTTRDVLA
jgi:ABC-2 type transport system permease protein